MFIPTPNPNRRRSDIEKDKFIDQRMELIFPNFLKKDGFKYMRLEKDIDDSTSNVVKGIDMIDVDELLERLIPHWQQEILLRKLTWKLMRSLKNLQQRARTRARIKRAEAKAEHDLEGKYVDRFGNDGQATDLSEFKLFCADSGVFATENTFADLYACVAGHDSSASGTTTALCFGEEVWKLGIRVGAAAAGKFERRQTDRASPVMVESQVGKPTTEPKVQKKRAATML